MERGLGGGNESLQALISSTLGCSNQQFMGMSFLSPASALRFRGFHRKVSGSEIHLTIMIRTHSPTLFCLVSSFQDKEIEIPIAKLRYSARPKY